MATLLARQAAQALRARQTVRIPSTNRPCAALPDPPYALPDSRIEPFLGAGVLMRL